MLATQTSAVLSAAGTPRAASLGATLRDSMATLAPTEPFIGASSAPSPRVASAGAPPLRRRPARHAAAEQPVGERQAVEQRAHEDVERQRLQEVVLEQPDDAAGQRGQQRICSTPPASDADRGEQHRHAHQHGDRRAGRSPAARSPTASSIQRPAASIRQSFAGAGRRSAPAPAPAPPAAGRRSSSGSSRDCRCRGISPAPAPSAARCGPIVQIMKSAHGATQAKPPQRAIAARRRWRIAVRDGVDGRDGRARGVAKVMARLT